MNSLLNKLLVILLLLCAISSGCAFSPAHLNLDYQSELGKKSPLSTIKPLTVSLNVEDQRVAGERDRVGNKKNGFGMVTAKVESNKEVGAIIYDAIKAELETNGHKVVSSKDSQPDVTINTRLVKYWGETNVRFFEIEMVATLNADISVLNPRNNSIAVSQPIEATFRESRQIATDGAFESVLNGALAEFIRAFSREPSLLEALRANQ